MKSVSPLLESGLGHMTWFGQCNTGKCDMSGDLKGTCTLGSALLQPLGTLLMPRVKVWNILLNNKVKESQLRDEPFQLSL